MDTADGDMQGDSFRPEQSGLDARSNDVVSFQAAAQPEAFQRTMSVRLSLGSSFANAVQVQLVEIFLVFANGVMCSELATELRWKSNAFLIRSFDTVESFLLYLMSHPMSRGSQRIAVSQLSFNGMSGVDGLAQIRKLEPNR